MSNRYVHNKTGTQYVTVEFHKGTKEIDNIVFPNLEEER